MSRSNHDEKIILGLDLVSGSPQSKQQPMYAVVVLEGEKLVYKNADGVKKGKLLELINKFKPDYVAIDNIYELGSNKDEVVAFIEKLPFKTSLIQVNPPDGKASLKVVANKYGVKLSSRDSPLNEALACALVVARGGGYKVVVFENETKVIVSEGRSLTHGGSSADRFRRKIHTLILTAAREIEEKLNTAGIDYDLIAEKGDYGLKRAEFTVYAPREKLFGIVKPKKGHDYRVEIKPVRKGELTFIPLTGTIPCGLTPQKKRYLLVGVDPGLNTGLAILDLNGRLLEVKSLKRCSRGDLIREITRHGIPLVFATDVTPPPKMIEKLAALFDAKLFAPSEPMPTEEKIELVRCYIEQLNEKNLNGAKPKDSHQRAALAAALKAYQKYKPLMEKVEAHIREKQAKVPVEEVKALVIKGISISNAIEGVKQSRQEVKPKRDVSREEKVKQPKEEPKEVLVLREKLKEKEREIELLKSRVRELEERVKTLEEEKRELERKIAEMREEERRAIVKSREIRLRDQMIESLKRLLRREREEKEKLLKELRKLNKVKELETSENLVVVKKLESLTKKVVQEARTKRLIKAGDVVYVVNPGGAGASTVEVLAEAGVKAVITDNPEKLPHMAFEKFRELKIPIIRRGEVKMEEVEGVVVAYRDSLEKAIKHWFKSEEEREKRESRNLLKEILSSYRRERMKTFLKKG